MSQNPLKDESALVKALQTREAGALERLYDLYADALHGIILRIVNDPEVASDTLQEVFVKIWRNAEGYDAQKGRLFTWMVNIARNAAIDHLRSKGHKSRANIQGLQDSVGMIERSHPVTMDVDHIGLKELMERLEPEQSSLLEMAYFQGFSQADLAEELNLPLGTVKSRMRAALKLLRQWIK